MFGFFAFQVKRRKCEEIADVKAKRACIEGIIQKLSSEVDTCAKEAETKKDWALLSKSNALRQKVEDHRSELSHYEQIIKDLEKD